jgi:signal transduction histidine kinase
MSDSECSLRAQAAADGLLHQVHQLNSIADKLLLLARADAGRLEVRFDEFDLSELLEGVLDDTRALAEPLDLAIEANVPETLPLKADRVYVGMIAQNLLENAIKYNQRGGRIKVTAQAKNGSVLLNVGNTGQGIPEERAAQLFGRFYRGRGDERVSGSGLGLTTARELARAHGGDVSLLQADSTWTELSLSLPRDG